MKLIVVSGNTATAPRELPVGVKFFPKPYREAAIVEAMVDMLSVGMASSPAGV